jgi:alpha-ribazole phosphatase
LSRLLLVRHGDTEVNSAERYWGSSDVKLGDAGIKQAEQLRHRLAAENIDAIYASDMSRALVTAEIIASEHRSEVITCAELREIDFGEFEGLTFAEISQRYPELAKLWAGRHPSLEFPGGESLGEFDKRIGTFMSRLEKHSPEETVLIVAHCGSLRVLLCRLLGIELQHRWQFRLDLASLSIVETYPQGAILNLLNDISHLR